MKKGQTVYLKTQGNLVRYSWGRYEKIIETTIRSVGTKYITVEYCDIKFNKDDLREKTDYCSDYALYESRQDILDENEYKQLRNKINVAFDMWAGKTFSLDQLREVSNILGLEEKQ